LRSGAKVSAKLLDLRRLDPPRSDVRIAVVVAKFGYSAVERNKLKRRLRELVRISMLPVLAPMDLLVRARREAYSATFEALRDDVASAALRLSRVGKAN
jgi:ribonuclease P protein component